MLRRFPLACYITLSAATTCALALANPAASAADINPIFKMFIFICLEMFSVSYWTFSCSEVIEVITPSVVGSYSQLLLCCIFSYKAFGFNFSNFFNFPICESWVYYSNIQRKERRCLFAVLILKRLSISLKLLSLIRNYAALSLGSGNHHCALSRFRVQR